MSEQTTVKQISSQAFRKCVDGKRVDIVVPNQSEDVDYHFNSFAYSIRKGSMTLVNGLTLQGVKKFYQTGKNSFVATNESRTWKITIHVIDE